jgi:CSLREA domain-containing protein
MLVYSILACVLFSTLAWGSAARAANFVVNTTLDSTDSNLGNGLCGNSEGFCSLRAAVQQANALDGPDTITLGAQSYEVTTVQSVPLGFDEEDAAASGDLDVTSEITITGAGATSTIIEGGGDGTRADRVLHVLPGGDLTLRQLTVRDGQATTNSATSLGGGIYNQGVLDLADCVIADNDANAGGGVFNAGVATIDACTFSGNAAEDVAITNAQGGAIMSSGDFADLEITGSTLSGNSADLAGQAIFTASGAVISIENSTLSGNLGGSGPALVLQNSDAVLTNVTIVGNSAAGLSAFSGDGTNTLDVANTIVANNGGNECSISGQSPILTITNSLASDATCTGFDLTDTDPQLGALADNGGPTLTHLPLPGSPAIDAGAASPTCPDLDQRGETRPVDGDGDSTAECDIGAVEAPEPGALAGGALALALAVGLARRRA